MRRVKPYFETSKAAAAKCIGSSVITSTMPVDTSFNNQGAKGDGFCLGDLSGPDFHPKS